MSSQKTLITSVFKKSKNPTNIEKVKPARQPQPSTSHEEDSELKILKEFDLNWVYGPCMGITRLERWNRAEKHGLNPPAEVKKIILYHSEDERYTYWIKFKSVMKFKNRKKVIDQCHFRLKCLE